MVGVRPIGRGAAMATHAVDVRSASGMVHRLILRRWTRPGWREEGPARVRDWHGVRLREPRYVKDL